MPKFMFIPLLAFFLLAGPAAARAEEEPGIIGTILAVEGKATVTHDGTKTAAAAKMYIYQKDLIETAAKSRMFILFIDDTQVTLGAKAKFSVTEYVFDEEKKEGNKASYNIFDGAFSYLSGLMTKQPEPSVRISTNYGSIGVRGTWLFGGMPGHAFKVFLQKGLIKILNGGGSTDLEPGEGTTLGEGDGPGEALPFSDAEIKELKELVKMKDWDAILKLVSQNKAQQKFLRKKFKEFMKNRGGYSLRMRSLPLDTIPPNTPFIPFGGDGGGRICCGGGGS